MTRDRTKPWPTFAQKFDPGKADHEIHVDVESAMVRTAPDGGLIKIASLTQRVSRIEVRVMDQGAVRSSEPRRFRGYLSAYGDTHPVAGFYGDSLASLAPHRKPELPNGFRLGFGRTENAAYADW